MAAIMLLASSGDALAQHSAAQLERAGWFCDNDGPFNWVHCLRGNGSDMVIVVKVFSEDGSEFLGTELLLHEDIYNGQPCPQDGGGPWFRLGDVIPDNPYFACHHFDTSAI
jgi:hypothetical protein